MAEYNPSKIIKDGNTYNFRDTTKIPLAGSNAISGSLIPATDNSIDIGSSTKNIKMLYTKGITINGTQFLPSDYATLSGLATVATSGNYNDLSNKPTIPTVNNATLTIQKNGTNVQTFTANQSTNATANIIVPTKTSDLTNDSGFITSDNTKIPLAGSNQISGDLIPSTDGTVNLGSPSYQWNNAYIKSLTINGVACGDILTHNVSEFVNVTSNQTIGGVKTFTSNIAIQGSRKVTCNLDNSFIELDGGTTWGKGGSIVLSGQDRSSYTNSVLIVSKSDTNTDILQYQNGELKPLSNNTNNSSLGTPTNKWSKVYSDDVVHTTGNETIGGVKTFSQEATMFGRDINLMSRLHYGKNSNPSTASWNYLFFRGNTATEGYTDSWYSGYLEQLLNTNGSARGRWLIRDTSENSVCLELSVNGSDKQVRPQENNTVELGTSTNKWKSFNGINPGALSLPGTGVIDVSSNITGLDGTTQNKFTPQINGWLHINGTGPMSDGFIYAVQGRVGMKSANNPSYGRCAVLIPVVAGAEVSITCKLTTLTWANITPCQGNV